MIICKMLCASECYVCMWSVCERDGMGVSHIRPWHQVTVEHGCSLAPLREREQSRDNNYYYFYYYSVIILFYLFIYLIFQC